MRKSFALVLQLAMFYLAIAAYSIFFAANVQAMSNIKCSDTSVPTFFESFCFQYDEKKLDQDYLKKAIEKDLGLECPSKSIKVAEPGQCPDPDCWDDVGIYDCDVTVGDVVCSQAEFCTKCSDPPNCKQGSWQDNMTVCQNRCESKPGCEWTNMDNKCYGDPSQLPTQPPTQPGAPSGPSTPGVPQPVDPTSGGGAPATQADKTGGVTDEGTAQTPYTTPDVSVLNKLGTTDFSQLIGRGINVAMGVIGSIALVMFIYGGFLWMIPRGESDKAEKGRNILVWSSLGIVVIFASYALLQFIFEIFE